MKGCVSVLYDIFPVQSRPKVFFQYQFLQSLIEGVVVPTWFNALLNSSCLTPYYHNKTVRHLPAFMKLLPGRKVRFLNRKEEEFRAAKKRKSQQCQGAGFIKEFTASPF